MSPSTHLPMPSPSPHRPPPALRVVRPLVALLALFALSAVLQPRAAAAAPTALRTVSSTRTSDVTTVSDICFSPYKCEEALDGLRQRMEHANTRFGKFTQVERNCILKGSRTLFESAPESACIKVAKLDERVLHMFGVCISELTQLHHDASKQQTHDSWSPFLPRLRAPSASEPESESLKSAADAAALQDEPPAQHVTMGSESKQSAVRTTYNTDCNGGQHWCCVFLGDEQSFSCFGWWCRGIEVNCT